MPTSNIRARFQNSDAQINRATTMKRQKKKTKKRSFIFLFIMTLATLVCYSRAIIAAKNRFVGVEADLKIWQELAEVACAKKTGVMKERCIANVSHTGDAKLAEDPKESALKSIRGIQKNNNSMTKKVPIVKKQAPLIDVKKDTASNERQNESIPKENPKTPIELNKEGAKAKVTGDDDNMPPEIFADPQKRQKTAEEACAVLKDKMKLQFCIDDIVATGFMSTPEMYQ